MKDAKMTNQEAYDYLLEVYKKSEGDDDRALTTALLALQKQMPREPEKQIFKRRLKKYDDGGTQYKCPGCKTYVGWYSNQIHDFDGRFDFCPRCGQKIDWEEGQNG